MLLPKEKSLFQEEVMRLVDATEQSIERSSKDQHAIYVSESRPGSVHDFKRYIKKALPLAVHTRVFADSGYL